MVAHEPRLRHRGFFLHSDTGEPDTGEFENPEGFVIRTKDTRRRASRQIAGIGSRSAGRSRFTHGRKSRDDEQAADHRAGAFRSESVTDSRQRAHSLR
jgi:hypothetical protein